MAESGQGDRVPDDVPTALGNLVREHREMIKHAKSTFQQHVWALRTDSIRRLEEKEIFIDQLDEFFSIEEITKEILGPKSAVLSSASFDAHTSGGSQKQVKDANLATEECQKLMKDIDLGSSMQLDEEKVSEGKKREMEIADFPEDRPLKIQKVGPMSDKGTDLASLPFAMEEKRRFEAGVREALTGLKECGEIAHIVYHGRAQKVIDEARRSNQKSDDGKDLPNTKPVTGDGKEPLNTGPITGDRKEPPNADPITGDGKELPNADPITGDGKEPPNADPITGEGKEPPNAGQVTGDGVAVIGHIDGYDVIVQKKDRPFLWQSAWNEYFEKIKRPTPPFEHPGDPSRLLLLSSCSAGQSFGGYRHCTSDYNRYFRTREHVDVLAKAAINQYNEGLKEGQKYDFNKVVNVLRNLNIFIIEFEAKNIDGKCGRFIAAGRVTTQLLLFGCRSL